jgi:hypothetical protein
MITKHRCDDDLIVIIFGLGVCVGALMTLGFISWGWVVFP